MRRIRRRPVQGESLRMKVSHSNGESLERSAVPARSQSTPPHSESDQCARGEDGRGIFRRRDDSSRVTLRFLRLCSEVSEESPTMGRSHEVRVLRDLRALSNVPNRTCPNRCCGAGHSALFYAIEARGRRAPSAIIIVSIFSFFFHFQF